MNIALLGGNGYIGREVTRQLLEKDPNVHITVVSRSGANQLQDTRITNVAADVHNPAALVAVLPSNIGAIFCLVGGLGGDEANLDPVLVMLNVARELKIPVVGCVGGTLGNKEFTTAKAAACEAVRTSGKNAVVVEPTLVYGAGRSDSLVKMVPILKFVGLFNKKMRPMRIEDVAEQITDGLISEVGALA